MMDCEGCAARREALKKISLSMLEWIKNPTKAMRPGSPEWIEHEKRIMNEHLQKPPRSGKGT
jgi:hypothetical protein